MSLLYTAVADDLRVIVLETKEGLRFAINYYPPYRWIHISKTMSYYPMSAEISKWFKDHME